LTLHVKFAARRHTEVDVIDFVGPVVVIGQDNLTQDSVLEGSLPVTTSLLRVKEEVEHGVSAHHLVSDTGAHQDVTLVLSDGCLVAGPQLHVECAHVDLATHQKIQISIYKSQKQSSGENTHLGMGIKEIPANQLQVEEVEALAHQNVEELQILVVATVHLPGQGDADTASVSVLQGSGQHHRLRVALGGVQNHSVEEVATLEALLLEHGLASVGPVLLGLEIHVVLVEGAISHLAKLEVIGHQFDGLASSS
jgi:hypothetical protein